MTSLRLLIANVTSDQTWIIIGNMTVVSIIVIVIVDNKLFETRNHCNQILVNLTFPDLNKACH